MHEMTPSITPSIIARITGIDTLIIVPTQREGARYDIIFRRLVRAAVKAFLLEMFHCDNRIILRRAARRNQAHYQSPNQRYHNYDRAMKASR